MTYNVTSPKKAYADQAHHASERGIEWCFTYEEWLEMWLISGKWKERGKENGKYCMCRYDDVGPYSVRNCYIGTVEQNGRDRWDGVEKIDNGKAGKIIELYLRTRITQREIGEMFGVDQSYVSRIVNKLRKKNA